MVKGSKAEEVEEKLNSILREQGLLINEDADPNGNEYLHNGFLYGGIYAFSVRPVPTILTGWPSPLN